jgi:hypothetical protein
MRIAKARSYCPYGEVRLIEDNEYTAWFDGACGPCQSQEEPLPTE